MRKRTRSEAEHACNQLAQLHVKEEKKRGNNFVSVTDTYKTVSRIIGHPLSRVEKNEVRWGFRAAYCNGKVEKTASRGVYLLK